MASIFACIPLSIHVNQLLSYLIKNLLTYSFVMTRGRNGTTMAPLSGSLHMPAAQSGEDLWGRMSRENHSACR
jgi:hypothetical protein